MISLSSSTVQSQAWLRSKIHQKQNEIQVKQDSDGYHNGIQNNVQDKVSITIEQLVFVNRKWTLHIHVTQAHPSQSNTM